MTRYNDWEIRLSNYLLANRYKHFQYGKHDCCLFAAGAVFSTTGIDIAERFRGKYSSRSEAVNLIRQDAASLKDLLEIVAKEYGLVEIPVLQAQRGDIVLLQRDAIYSLGIVGMDGKIIAPSDIGYINISERYTRIKAYKV